MVMHVICVAAARMWVESVRELIISIYENRNNKFRPISEERAVLEMNIAINVAKYWNNSGKQKTGDWRFDRKSQNMRDFAALKVINRMSSAKLNLQFMT